MDFIKINETNIEGYGVFNKNKKKTKQNEH